MTSLVARLSLMAAVVLLAAAPACAAPFVLGNSTRGWVELVSWKPRTYVLHGFLTHAECDHLIQAAEPGLQRSLVVASNGSGVLDAVRTSSGMFLSKNLDEVVGVIEERVATMVHLPNSHAENLQVLKYELGQEYRAHYDTLSLPDDVAQRAGHRGGQRTATLLMYLSDVEEGGETGFPQGKWIDKEAQAQPPYTECGAKGLSVKPRKGDAVLFWSLKPDGKSKDFYSLHAGCPVLAGTKYSATSWVHVEPYQHTAPAAAADTGCRDNHEKCPDWAARGECEKNPRYMKGNDKERGNCRLSCKVCRICLAGDVLCERENARSLPKS